MNIQEGISLKPFNTFGIDVRSRFFAEITSVDELCTFIQLPYYKKMPFLVIGVGSNILFTNDFPGTILKISNKGITILDDDSRYYYVRAASGENWDELVKYCVDKNIGGLENLSGIPGSVGASPIQNIGAYGAELKDVFLKLDALDIQCSKIITFEKESCNFGYRSSIFKNKMKGRFIILNVTFRLDKNPRLNLNYDVLKNELVDDAHKDLNIGLIREAVINIRSRKLPDPAITGNAGSFFKNPEIEEDHFLFLKDKYPDIPSFYTDNKLQKVPAAWLIEQCGWKAYRSGNSGVHKDQPLVLVNFGNATGKEIANLAVEIQASVKKTFDIQLELEVNIV